MSCQESYIIQTLTREWNANTIHYHLYDTIQYWYCAITFWYSHIEVI